jgi:hypothetical protein
VIRVYDEAGNVIDARARGRFQRAVEPLSRDFFEYQAEAGVVDFRYPPFAFANARIFFGRAIRAELFTVSAGQQRLSRFSKTNLVHRFSNLGLEKRAKDRVIAG